MQLDFQDLQLNGFLSLLRALEEIQTAVDRLNAIVGATAEEIAELQYLWSEKLMAQLLAPPPAPATLSKVVADPEQPLGRPPNIQAATVDEPSASWQPAGRVQCVHSPGYPADESEISAHEIDAFLHPGDWG